MTPNAQDALQVLLCKAAYWAQSAAGAGPFPAGMYSNMTPFAQDPLQVLAAKLAYWLQQISAGGGVGASVTKQALGGLAPGAGITTPFVFDTDTGFLWYNSGTSGAPTWNNV